MGHDEPPREGEAAPADLMVLEPAEGTWDDLAAHHPNRAALLHLAGKEALVCIDGSDHVWTYDEPSGSIRRSPGMDALAPLAGHGLTRLPIQALPWPHPLPRTG